MILVRFSRHGVWHLERARDRHTVCGLEIESTGIASGLISKVETKSSRDETLCKSCDRMKHSMVLA